MDQIPDSCRYLLLLNYQKNVQKCFFFVLQEVAVSTLEHSTDLLYNGFYCCEAITTRSLRDGICGICGVAGEVNLGDGNQKSC